MKEEIYFKNNCPNCDGGIEFPAHGVGEEIECPHCKRAMTLNFMSSPECGATQQIDGYLEISSFPTKRAELLFLKTFTFPTDLGEIRGIEIWQRALEDEPKSTVAGFITVGMLQKGNAEVVTLLQSNSKDELKSLAKARDLGQSGTKEVLAKRLFKADPTGMSEFFRGKTYFTCTAKGRLIVAKFIESETELRQKAECVTESALREGRFDDACTILATFEASKVFPRGVGIDWNKYDGTHDLELLNEITTIQSKRHRDLPESVLISLRVSAGMMNLWGTNNPAKWLNDSEREYVNEAHTIWSTAVERVRLRGMKRSGVNKVQVLSTGRDDICAICKKADRKIYGIDAAPELPHEGCTCEYGCGCMLICAE